MTSLRKNTYMVTKNSKLEAKIARYLDADPNAPILGYDACIQDNGISKSFRLIILGLDSIYMTDNPVKVEQLQKPFCYYRDILRAEMIDDFPSFLIGQERENCLHLRLRIILPSEKKKKKKDSEVDPSEMETVSSLFDRASLEKIQSFIDPSANDDEKSNLAPLPQFTAALPILLSTEQNKPTDSNETDPFHLPLEKLEETSRSWNGSLEFRQNLEMLTSRSDRSHVERLFSSQRPLVQEKSGSGTSRSKKSYVESDWPSENARINAFGLQRHEHQDFGIVHTPRIPHRTSAEKQPKSLTSRSTYGKIDENFNDDENLYCPSLEEIRSLSNEGDPVIRDYNIYFLMVQSKIPEMLAAALNNYAVISTLRYAKNLSNSKTAADREKAKQISEKIAVKFSHMKDEILQKNLNKLDAIELVEELRSACEKHFKVKELFWKDADLFKFYVKRFQSTLEKIEKNERDERRLRFSFSISQLFEEVFLDSFFLPQRTERLSENQCTEFRTLVDLLLRAPTIIRELEGKVVDENAKSKMIKKCYQHILDWTFSCSTILWFIGDIVTRPSWTNKDFRLQDFLSTVENFPRKNEFFDLFVDALVSLTVKSQSKEIFSPRFAVIVYQFYWFLSFLFVNSPTFLTYFRDRYSEDFQFFLRTDLILSRIPVQYPVYRFIPDLIRSVTNRVLLDHEKDRSQQKPTKHRQLI